MRIYYTILLFCLFSLIACKPDNKIIRDNFFRIQGETMGTYYSISYLSKNEINHKATIDSILLVINEQVSTYDPKSTISLFNQNKSGITLNLKNPYHYHFIQNFKQAQKAYKDTEGAFEPTIGPLVEYWGFGAKETRVTQIDTIKVKQLLQLVGFNNIEATKKNNSISYTKPNADIQINFSAIAKGYAVDMISKWLEKHRVKDYLVEIGGEVRVKGKNAKNTAWKVGINTPKPDVPTDDIYMVMELHDQSAATSGNYRNFYEYKNQKYTHTVNPANGFTVRSRLLSTTVITKDCAYADAYATAFMVMGLDKAFKTAQRLNNVEACFIYSDEKGNMQTQYTKGFEHNIKH